MDLCVSAIVLAMRAAKSETLKLRISIKCPLPKEFTLEERLADYAKSLTSLETVNLTEEVDMKVEDSRQAIRWLLILLVQPSLASLKRVRLMLDSGEVVLDMLERMKECRLQALHLTITNDVRRFAAAVDRLDTTHILELRLHECNYFSGVHLVDVMRCILKCTKLERLALDFDCPDRQD